MEHDTDESGPQPSGPQPSGPQPSGQEQSSPESSGAEPSGLETGAAAAARRPVTGEPRVDAALARLDELPELPVTEHRAVFEHVHRSLTEVLGELDAGPPLGSGGAGGAGSRPG